MEKKLTIRTAIEKDFLNIWGFVRNCKPLESYGAHFYRIMLRYFGDSCFIAEQDGEIVGFILGFETQRHPGSYFLWQIGVHPKFQGQGIGAKILAHMEDETRRKGCVRIEVTIDPENCPSQKLFEKIGFSNVSNKEGETIKVEGNLAVKDYYDIGRHFMLYEKTLQGA